MTAPRLLIVAHYFAPSSDTSAQRSTRLARFLAERGAPPVVVSAAPQLYGGEVFPGPSLRDELEVFEVPSRPIYGTLRGLGPPGRYAQNLLLQRAYGRAVERALEEGPRPDFVYWWGHPFWYFPLAPGVRRRTGIPCVLDFVDVWYMGGVHYRKDARTGPRKLVDRRAEAAAVRGADLVLMTTDEQTRLYRERFPDLPPERFMTVRWGYDERELSGVEPAPKPEGLARLAILGRFSVYSADDARALAAAVAACAEEKRMEAVHVGGREPGLERAFADAGAGGLLRAMGMVPYSKCLSVLASADCGAATPLSKVSVPVKVYDYIGLDRPFLAFAPPGSAMARLLGPVPGGLVVQGPGQATEALRRIVRGEVTACCPEADRRPYSQQHQFELLLDRLESLGGGPA